MNNTTSIKAYIEDFKTYQEIQSYISDIKHNISQILVYQEDAEHGRIGMDQLVLGLADNTIKTFRFESRSAFNHAQHYYGIVEESGDAKPIILDHPSVDCKVGVLKDDDNQQLSYELYKYDDKILGVSIKDGDQYIISSYKEEILSKA